MTINLLLPFVAYFSILLTIGLLSHKKQNSAADYIVGNRSLNFWVTALSAQASDMSSWLFMGFPAGIFLGGLSGAWIAIALFAGMLLNWQFVAKKLRIATEKYDSYTLSTFFGNRFHDNSNVLRVLTALISTFFLTCYVSAGLIGIGNILNSMFHIDFQIGLVIATSIVFIYTFVGGFVTVAWTDLFQALFLIAMIILVPIIAYLNLENGFETILSIAIQKEISLNLIPDTSWESILGIIFLILGWAPGYFGQPHIVTKFMGINDASNIYKAKYVGMVWLSIALTAATAVGLVGIAFFPQGLDNPELVFVEMVKSLFHPLGAGFVLCGVLAAGMSTMDSQILVCGSVLSEDLYKTLIRKNATSKELLLVSRASVFLISMFSLFLALSRNTTILEAVLYAWAGLGSAFGPLVLMALYSKNANKYGAITGVLVGGILAAIWPSVNFYFTSIEIPSMVVAFPLNLLTIYVVSMCTGGAKRLAS